MSGGAARDGSRRVAKPEHGYRSAFEGAALFALDDRVRLRIHGRAPRRMLDGILTGTLPARAARVEPGVWAGTATYHAVLTPKGKMVTDLWTFMPPGDPGGGGDDEAAEEFLLDVPPAGAQGLEGHLTRFLPPRFARVEDVTDRTSMIAVAGPEASALLSRGALGIRVDPDVLSGLEEGAWRATGSGWDALMVARTREIEPEAYRVLGPREVVRALRDQLVEAGAAGVGRETWTTLRVEAGRPEFGSDMTEATIPVEAGIHDRAIDYAKGCYTGQEVIVRIRDRGHVNRHLKRLVLGPVEPPPAGTELFAPGAPDKPVGWVTSAVRSPAEGGAVALAYVRRGTETVEHEGRTIPVP